MSRVLLPLVLYLIPAVMLLYSIVPRRYGLLPPALAGLAFVWLTGGFPAMILLLTSVCAAWLYLRLYPQGAERKPEAAGLWLASGLAVQGLLLLAAKYLLPSPLLMIPQLVCAMQTAECMTERRAGKLSAMGLFPYFCYSCGLPHIIAGPPVRWGDAASLWQERKITAAMLGEGASRCIRGLFQLAVLSMPMHTLQTELTESGAPLSAADAWAILPVCYFALYYGLRGAGEIGQGLAHMLGFRMPQQFDTPLLAGTLHGFRARFLIPENAWCERILPLPAGNPIGACVRLTVLLGGLGLLIGQGVCGLLWGIVSALFLTAEHLINPEVLRPIPLTVRRLLTAVLVLLPLGILRSGSVQELFPFYRALLGFGGMPLSEGTSYLLGSRAVLLMLCTAGLFPLARLREAIARRFSKTKDIRLIITPLLDLLMLAAALSALYSDFLRA